MNAPDYFYRDKEGREVGPLALDTLAKFRLAGVLDGDTPVRAADSAEWKPFRNIIADAPVLPPAAQPTVPQPEASVPGTLGGWRNKWVLVALAAVALGLILWYSISGTPSANDGERAIQNRIKQESEGRITLAKFQKTNGQEGELLGVKMYGLEFEAEIEFTEDCKWSTGMLGQGMSFRTSKPVPQPQSGFSWNSFIDDTTNPGTLVKRGQKVTLSGVVRFVKKEAGWAVDDVQLTKANVGNVPVSARAEAVPSKRLQDAKTGASSASSALPDKADNGARKGAATKNTLSGRTLFSDDFRDDSIDPSKWTTSGNSVAESDHLMKVSTTVTDAGGSLTSVAFPVAAEGKITITRRVNLHYGNDFFLARFGITIGGLPTFAINYANIEYADGATYMARKGFFISRNDANPMYVRSEGDVNGPIAPVWDSWFLESISYDPGSGVLEYFVDNVRQTTYNVGALPPASSPTNMSLSFNAWGWYTGHQHVFGNLVVTQTAPSTPSPASRLAQGTPPSARAPQTGAEPDPAGASRACINNLKSIGLALRTWGIDHDGDFPFNAATKRGGSKELCSLGSDGFDSNAFLHFMVMSNELSTPKILVCPADSSKHPAEDFRSLQAGNVTYQMRSGVNIDETHPNEVVVRCPIHGHVVECDGSVQSPRHER